MVVATIALQKRGLLTSTEAEYVALAEAVISVVWLRIVLPELGFYQQCMKIFQDNNGCI